MHGYFCKTVPRRVKVKWLIIIIGTIFEFNNRQYKLKSGMDKQKEVHLLNNEGSKNKQRLSDQFVYNPDYEKHIGKRTGNYFGRTHPKQNFDGFPRFSEYQSHRNTDSSSLARELQDKTSLSSLHPNQPQQPKNLEIKSEPIQPFATKESPIIAPIDSNPTSRVPQVVLPGFGQFAISSIKRRSSSARPSDIKSYRDLLDQLQTDEFKQFIFNEQEIEKISQSAKKEKLMQQAQIKNRQESRAKQIMKKKKKEARVSFKQNPVEHHMSSNEKKINYRQQNAYKQGIHQKYDRIQRERQIQKKRQREREWQQLQIQKQRQIQREKQRQDQRQRERQRERQRQKQRQKQRQREIAVERERQRQRQRQKLRQKQEKYVQESNKQSSVKKSQQSYSNNLQQFHQNGDTYALETHSNQLHSQKVGTSVKIQKKEDAMKKSDELKKEDNRKNKRKKNKRQARVIDNPNQSEKSKQKKSKNREDVSEEINRKKDVIKIKKTKKEKNVEPENIENFGTKVRRNSQEKQFVEKVTKQSSQRQSQRYPRRTRVKPVQYWQNEKVHYKGGIVVGIERVQTFDLRQVLKTKDNFEHLINVNFHTHDIEIEIMVPGKKSFISDGIPEPYESLEITVAKRYHSCQYQLYFQDGTRSEAMADGKQVQVMPYTYFEIANKSKFPVAVFMKLKSKAIS